MRTCEGRKPRCVSRLYLIVFRGLSDYGVTDFCATGLQPSTSYDERLLYARRNDAACTGSIRYLSRSGIPRLIPLGLIVVCLDITHVVAQFNTIAPGSYLSPLGSGYELYTPGVLDFFNLNKSFRSCVDLPQLYLCLASRGSVRTWPLY